MTCSTVGVDKSAYHPPLPPIRPSQTQDSCKGRQRKSWGRGKACSLWQTPFQVRQSGWLSSGSGLEILHWLWPYLGVRHFPLTIRNRVEFWKYILTSSRVLFQWTGFSHGTDGVSCLNIEKHGAAAATRPPTHSLMIPGFPKAHRRFKCTTRCAPQECFTCMLLYIQQTCCILYLGLMFFCLGHLAIHEIYHIWRKVSWSANLKSINWSPTSTNLWRKSIFHLSASIFNPSTSLYNVWIAQWCTARCDLSCPPLGKTNPTLVVIQYLNTDRNGGKRNLRNWNQFNKNVFNMSQI